MIGFAHLAPLAHKFAPVDTDMARISRHDSAKIGLADLAWYLAGEVVSLLEGRFHLKVDVDLDPPGCEPVGVIARSSLYRKIDTYGMGPLE
jgi:hypothetical protein